MANENYENVNDQMQGQPDEQHEQQRDNRKSKPHDMLDAWQHSMDVARATLTEALKEVRKDHPDMGIGSVVRRFHMAILEGIKENPLMHFNVVFGLLGFAVFDSLTDEDKEALRNDLFDNH
jgi:hypothetical protein